MSAVRSKKQALTSNILKQPGKTTELGKPPLELFGHFIFSLLFHDFSSWYSPLSLYSLNSPAAH